jgi:PKD repeat protein
MVNPRPSRPLTAILARWMLALLVLPALFLLARPLTAQTVDCTKAERTGCAPDLVGSKSVCFTPAQPVPAALWGGELQPVVEALPKERDATSFNEFLEAYWSRNFFYGLEIRNGWVIMGLAHGIGVWDARTSPASPAFVSAKRYGPAGDGVFPYIPGGESSKIVFLTVSAPDDTVAALAGANGGGLLVFDLTDKTQPRGAYQNFGKSAQSVWAAKIGSTRYAFLAATNGLFVYDLDKALNHSACLDDSVTTASGGLCSDVFLGQIQTPSSPAFVQGDGNYLAVSFGTSGGFQIFDVSSPLGAQLKLTGLRGSALRSTQGIALWHQGSSYYLAARLGTTLTQRQPQTAIFDVSCITTATGCTGLGAPLSTLNIDTLGTADLLTFSRSGSTPFLYVGGDNYCLGADGQQHEWLLDASDPFHPRDVTPNVTIQKSGTYNGVDNVSKTINYWSYYDRASPTGFNFVTPLAGKFNGSYFYRAARSIFDVHQWLHDVAPTADFSWSPTQVYPGTPVTFTDASTGAPTSWNWTFQDGTPANATTASVPVTFATAGTKSVSLTSQNVTGPSSPVTKSIIVLSPTPQIGSVTVSPSNPSVCQPVTFTATGVTGQPTLAYNWALAKDGVTPVPGVTSSTPTLAWTTTGSTASGSYTAAVTVSNGAGTATKSVSVNLAALPPLAYAGAGGAPENDPFIAGTVQFHAKVAGASTWSWDFGDGQGFRPVTTDPVNGPNPTFTYASKGTYMVRVKVGNCVQGEIDPSAPLTVHITQTTPLIAAFQAQLTTCIGSFCAAANGQSIPFADTSTGADHWDYDWNHTPSSQTCNFTDADHTTPVIAHTYTVNGDYTPCLRVRRGASEQNVAIHGDISVSNASGGGGGGGTASTSVNGVTSGQINQAYSYTASATGCSPASSGWNWSTGGGTISSGAANSNSISITWSTAGTKTVSATNSACSGAQGVPRVVIITDPNNGGGGGGGTLQAKLSFSPASPNPGDTVSFDASASTGSPTSYTWNFGDSSQATGKTATHAYALAGSYVVQLTVGAPATGCPFAPCVASSTATQTIVVQGTPPPPPVSAAFTTSATCTNVGGFDLCQAQAGQAVTLTATTTNADSYQWSFGDGTTGSAAAVTHTWSKAGSYFVTLAVTKGASSDTKNRSFTVTGSAPPPPPTVKEVVLPWIAQTRGALVQSSDLYVHNPGANPMGVTLEFRKRGLPDTNPPRIDKTVAPGATLYVADVLRELFNRENIAGFVSLTVNQGDGEPVITSYNTTVQADGKQFGQTIGGISMNHLASAAAADGGSQRQHLVGLISNSDRLAYFGVSNPGDTAATYHLRLFDKTGKMIGESSQDLTVSPFGQRQFQSAEIQSLFGVSNQDDYRVEVETKTGGMLLPYASNLRLASNDPSFIEAGSVKNTKAYLLGVLSAPGTNNSQWQSDLLLSNIGTQAATADVTFTSIGLNAVPTNPLHVALQPGATQRLANVVAGQLGVANGIGVLTVNSSSPEGVFPVVQGESYDNSVPTKRFGQAMAAVTDADAAGSGQSHYMVGLRQDATHRTTFWLFNPGSSTAQYDVLYRGLDGSVIGSTRGVVLGAGKLRQFSPNQHPLPAAGVQDGFTVQIVVTSGKVLSAAQVVNNATNDPSYIQGEVR